MKRFVLLVALSLALPVCAQDKKPEAKPAASKEAKKANPNPKRQADARHCLEKGDNTEIIKCAEAYL
jgi:hypothetical protein